MSKQRQLFLGALCGGGFVSHFADLLDDKYTVYIIKGSSGSGKSTMLRRFSRALTERGLSHTLVRCSSDADSLDGVICEPLGVAMIDGTAPHTVEPQLLCGKHRVVSLYRYLDVERLLPHEREVAALMRKNRAELQAAGRALKAACSVYAEIAEEAGAALERKRTHDYFSSLARRIIPSKCGESARNDVFFAAVTDRGYQNNLAPNLKAYERVIVVNDPWCEAALAGIETVAAHATNSGYALKIGRFFLEPSRIAALAIDELSLLICACGFIDRNESGSLKTVNAARFYTPERLASRRNRLGLYKKSCRWLVGEAAQRIAAAKAVHDGIEGYYKAGMDFRALDEESARLFAEILT